MIPIAMKHQIGMMACSKLERGVGLYLQCSISIWGTGMHRSMSSYYMPDRGVIIVP